MNEKIQKIFSDLNIDGLLLTDYYNKRYFTGFTGTTGQALITKEKKYFYSDFRYVEQATLQTKPYGFTFVRIERRAIDNIIEGVEKHNVKRLGFDDLSMSYSDYQMYSKALPNVELVPAGNEMLNARQIKSQKEIEYLKKAASITDIAFSETLKIIKEGITEKEIAAHLEYIQRLNGAEDKSFETIVASGHRSSMPHGVASDKKIQRNEFITMDFGCLYNGYASDMTRTIFFGDKDKISSEQKRIYDLVYEGQSMGIEMLKPGVIGSSVEYAVRDYFKKNGDMDKYFGHSLGHSFGLEVHEPPYCSRVCDDKLQENMVMTVEPGIYIENFCGVRIEDDILITKDGHERMTKSPRELIFVG